MVQGIFAGINVYDSTGAENNDCGYKRPFSWGRIGFNARG